MFLRNFTTNLSHKDKSLTTRSLEISHFGGIFKAMRKTTIFIILILLAAAEFAQAAETGRIEGRVIDAITKEPMIGLNVNLIETGRGASTDMEGRFVIDRLEPGTYILQFSYIGYETVTRTDVIVNSARPTQITQEMKESTIDMGTVTVKSGYFSKKMEAPVSLTLLSREEIRRFPGGFEDVVRTVTTLPGVSVIGGGGRNDLLVRGGGPSENLYIVNNMEVPNINHFGTQGTSGGTLSFINLDFVDATEFSSGGFSVRYGDKMSSVLSLDMRPGRSDQLGGKATVSATQFGLNVEGPLSDKGSFLFSARKSYLDLIFRAAGFAFVPVYTDFNFFGVYDVTPKDRLTVLGLTAIDRVDRDMSSEENRVENAGILDNTQNQIISGINYRHLYGLGFFDVTLNHNYNEYQFNQVDEFEEEYFSSDATEQEYNLKLGTTIKPGKSYDFNIGASYKHIRNDNLTVFADSVYNRSGQKVPYSELGVPQRSDINLSTYKAAGYVEFESTLGNGLSTVLGLRADYYDFIDDALYPSARLALGYRASELLKFKTSVGRYYQSPSYVWVLNDVNRDLKALRNDMVIGGFDYILLDDLIMSVEGYYKQYRDLPTGATADTDYLVLTNTGAGFGGREDDFQSFGYIPLVSEGEGNAYGFELLFQKKFSDIPCYGQISFSYGKSEYTAGNGETYPGQYDRRFIFNLSGGYKFNANWEISTRFQLLTGSPYTPVYRPADNNGDIQNLPEEYLSERLETSHQLDVRVDRRFNFNRWTMILFLDIQNIYNYKPQNIPRYDFWEDRVDEEDTIGILPSIGISAEF